MRAVARAQVLLGLDQGWSGYVVAAERGLSAPTVYRIRQRYPQEGLAAALGERARSGAPRRFPRRFDGAARAALMALACAQAPVGHSRWTLRLLADKAVELRLVDIIFHETVGQVLKKTSYSPIASSTGAWAK